MLQTQLAALLQSRATVEATAVAFNTRQNSHMRVIAAYSALKRTGMIKDMQAMVKDYLEEGMEIGSEAYINKSTQLAYDVTVIQNMALDTGIVAGVLN